MTTLQVDALLNKQSGLKGIAGENDMRRLIANAIAGDQTAELAIEMYVYAVQKIIGAYSSQLATLDALIFTGGIGENAALIRERVITPLKHLEFELNSTANSSNGDENCRLISSSGKSILVIRGDEEAFIAQKTADKNSEKAKSRTA
ncbi:hypothetical protein [Legionella tunisiensis]|uniref:hypothetical protein n=1 Tax=Legionella tunisiensis TaxID=1034944 RepID=UPI0002E21FA4|nr:hypothetical protein [Legionella tunisiensis]